MWAGSAVRPSCELGYAPDYGASFLVRSSPGLWLAAHTRACPAVSRATPISEEAAGALLETDGLDPRTPRSSQRIPRSAVQNTNLTANWIRRGLLSCDVTFPKPFAALFTTPVFGSFVGLKLVPGKPNCG